MSKNSLLTTTDWESLPVGFSPAEPLYVFTDIHGCFGAMSRLLSRRPPDTRLVFLGDAIDRGPFPLEVLAVLMSSRQNILLHGNHDAMAWYVKPRNVDGKEVYVVSGHTPLDDYYAMCPFGITPHGRLQNYLGFRRVFDFTQGHQLNF